MNRAGRRRFLELFRRLHAAHSDELSLLELLLVAVMRDAGRPLTVAEVTERTNRGLDELLDAGWVEDRGVPGEPDLVRGPRWPLRGAR